jgi:peptidyl-prolyl cis-trans isomerase D
MISWMQRHRKYLVVTIWISTIAFIGAGFVGWGQYSYGDKASAVAKVGDIDISARELQSTYGNLYSRYNQLFQGNFDQAQAKSLGLEKMAMKQLVDQALILNLAAEYGLQVSDKELLDAIQSQQYFFQDGSFDKETYHKVLKQNGMNVRDYEADVRKSLLIQKTLALFPQQTSPIETEALAALSNIADKIEYKVLISDMINIDATDDKLHSYWEGHQHDYMTLPAYTLEVVTQPALTESHDDAALQEYYTANRTGFTDASGKILPFEEAKDAVTEALNAKATHKAALKQYIAFKKGKLEGAATETLVITEADQPFAPELFEAIRGLSTAEPFLKPKQVGSDYKTFKLTGIKPAQPKSFEAAMKEVLKDYLDSQMQIKLQELAEGSVATFTGTTTSFLTRSSEQTLEGLTKTESTTFINELFAQQTKRGYITLDNTKIVLFHILEQKLLKTPQTDLSASALRLKASLLDRGLVKMLENRYPVEIYIKGL